jgi:hypothetical protein
MKLKSLLIAGMLMIPAIFSNQVKADEKHQYLATTIRSLGVPVTINTKIHCPPGESGSYFTAGFMVICQDNRREEGVEVQWTENDLDTLRHESHHLIQDCAAGGIGDKEMSLFFNSKEELIEFLSNSGYTEQQLQEIATHYQKQGVDGYDLLMELEAFAVARSIPANLIADKIKEYCTQ